MSQTTYFELAWMMVAVCVAWLIDWTAAHTTHVHRVNTNPSSLAQVYQSSFGGSANNFFVQMFVKFILFESLQIGALTV